MVKGIAITIPFNNARCKEKMNDIDISNYIFCLSATAKKLATIGIIIILIICIKKWKENAFFSAINYF